MVPDIPTIAETVPGFDVFSWFAFFVPARTPPDVIARINADTNAALVHPPVKSRFEDLGANPKGSTPAQLAAFLKSETEKWGPVIREAQIRVETEDGTGRRRFPLAAAETQAIACKQRRPRCGIAVISQQFGTASAVALRTMPDGRARQGGAMRSRRRSMVDRAARPDYKPAAPRRLRPLEVPR